MSTLKAKQLAVQTTAHQTTRTERLTNLARVVAAAPAHRFHMRKFMEETECGTAYCAAGWASHDLWFKQQGFPFPSMVLDDCILHPTESLAEFFSISETDADALFALNAGTHIGPHAITKEDVLGNIQALLAGEDAEEYAAISGDE